ncbi:MAG TPA: histidine kinase dimerization/phospho-acceptor domain-containing protein [Gemmatimonadales bacterium]
MDQEDKTRRLRHDLANPLAALLTETQLLLLNEASLDPETVRALREIESIARHMRDVLNASRGMTPGAGEANA